MKIIKVAYRNPYLQIVLIALLLAVNCTLLGLWPDLNKGEWASWVQAIGSLLAIFAALEIYRRQADDKRRDAQVHAIIAAARIMPYIATVAAEISSAVERLKQMRHQQHASQTQIFATTLACFKASGDWDIGTLLLISPLPNDCALKIASGIGRMDTGMYVLKDSKSSARISTDEAYRQFTIDYLIEMFEAAHEYLYEAGTQLQASAHIPTPPAP